MQRRTQLTVVHEAVVAEPHSQCHSILSGRAVSLGNQISDAQSWSVTMPVYTFSETAEPPRAERRCPDEHILIIPRLEKTTSVQTMTKHKQT